MTRRALLIIAGCAALLAVVSCVTPKPAVVPPAAAAAPSLAGDWRGAIVVGAQSLAVVVHFRSGPGGSLSATIDIPQQNASGLPLADITVNGNRVAFALHAGSDVARFSGERADETISGDFSQGPARGSFKLQSVRLTATPPAATKEVGTSIELHTPTGILYGSLVLPTGAPPYAVALIIAGSGPTDRNGNSPGLGVTNNSLEKLSVALAQAGIASVRYDKRGVGQSAPALVDPATLRFETYVDDAVAWIRLLRADDRFGKIIVVGHSEGSLIGMIAAQRTGADAFVSIAGAGEPANVLLMRQLAAQPADIRDESARIIRSLVQGRTVAKVDPRLDSLFRPSVQPYLISWFRYDPTREIARLRMPVLVVQGTTDLQVSMADARALHAADPDSRLLIVEGMNHVMVEAPEERAANIATYSEPDRPLDPAFVDGLTKFMQDVAGLSG